MALLRSIQSKEEWTLWASAHTDALTRTQLIEALSTLSLTRDGAFPLDVSCPSFREALLGPTGAALNQRGTCLPGGARSFVVLGPPSAMLAELSALDQVVADAPADEERTVLRTV